MLVSNYVPAIENSPVDDKTFNNVFSNSPLAVLASMISYLLAQLIDIRIYHFWKNLTKGKHLWLRNNFSTFTSQFIDSFSVIFFLTIFQILDWSQFVGLVFSAFIFKILVAAFDTPFLYILVGIFRKKFELKINEEINIDNE